MQRAAKLIAHVEPGSGRRRHRPGKPFLPCGRNLGVAVERGCLDVSAPLTHYIPELQGSAYEGATVRDALDMRVGVQFNEDYHATGGAIIEYRKSHLWDPVPVGESATDLRRFFSTLTERDGVHGGRFHYVSPNTDLLGWVLERATGTRYADWVSECLWQPIQAERDAYITVDRLGAPRCAGGFCAGPRDMARLGFEENKNFEDQSYDHHIEVLN